MTKRRTLSKTVSAVVDDYRLEKALQRNRSFLCIYCSKAKIEEVVVKPKDLCIIDSSDVAQVVAYRVSCNVRPKKCLYDKARSCYDGDDKQPRNHNCSTCIHAEPYRVPVKQVLVNQYRVNCTCYRILYKCTNPKRAEQFPNSTYMCSYVNCEHYERNGE